MGRLEEKRKFAGEKKASMKRRDEGHDYSERRMYMITMEVEGTRPLFGRLKGNPFAQNGSSDEPDIELTALGKAVRDEWFGIPRYYPQIEVMAVQMMPDHMHGILFVRERLPVHLGQVISGFKAGCRKAQRNFAFAAAEPLPAEKGDGGSLYVAAPSLQSSVSLPPLFAKGYNDLILRSFDELPTWRNYLRDNPRRLLLRRACPEWLRPAFGITIGPYVCSAIGNRELLSAECRVQVRVSRRLVGEALDKEVEHFLTIARSGAVLVSPAISPGEKRIMRSAFNEKLPIVVVVENGFTPLSKPHGEQFYACGEGRLLILSPWEHHNEKVKLTAQQCKEMNLLAWEICR